jgi:hypothetical protein
MMNVKDEEVVVLVACLFKEGQPNCARENLCEQLTMFALSAMRYTRKSKLYIYTNNKNLIEYQLQSFNIKSSTLKIVFLDELSEKCAVKLMNGCSNQYTFAKIDAIRALALRQEFTRGVLVSDIDTIIGPAYKSVSGYSKPTALDYYEEHNHRHMDFAEALDIIAGDEIYNKDYWASKKIRISSGYMYMDKEFCRFVLERSWQLCLNMYNAKELVEIKAKHFGDELIFTVLYQMYDTNIMVNASKSCDAVIYWTCHVRQRKSLVLPPINKIKHVHLPALKWQNKVRRIVIKVLRANSISNGCSWIMIYTLLNLVAIYQQLTSEGRTFLVKSLNLKILRSHVS